jgi:hypothetical protein
LFEPIINQIRPQVNTPLGTELASSTDEDEKSVFDHLSTENYKYMNYGRSVVRGGDPVVCVAYQPGYSYKYGPFNTSLFKRQTTDQLLVLTENELILIKEDKRLKNAQERRYGGIFTYIRRAQIENVQFIPHLDRSDCLVKINFPNDVRITAELLLNNNELGPLRNALEGV